jgi:predicted nucleic acid-binding protein
VSSGILFDSSAWIELLSAGPLEKNCRAIFSKATEVIVPTVVQYEVYRKTLVTVSEDRALSAVALLNQQTVLPMTTEVALLAADLSIQHKLGMADSLVLAHSQIAKATLVTLDNDFSSIAGVQIIRQKN